MELAQSTRFSNMKEEDVGGIFKRSVKFEETRKSLVRTASETISFPSISQSVSNVSQLSSISEKTVPKECSVGEIKSVRSGEKLQNAPEKEPKEPFKWYAKKAAPSDDSSKCGEEGGSEKKDENVQSRWWNCAQCHARNHPRRDLCFKNSCRTPRPDTPALSSGDSELLARVQRGDSEAISAIKELPLYKLLTELASGGFIKLDPKIDPKTDAKLLPKIDIASKEQTRNESAKSIVKSQARNHEKRVAQKSSAERKGEAERSQAWRIENGVVFRKTNLVEQRSLAQDPRQAANYGNEGQQIANHGAAGLEKRTALSEICRHFQSHVVTGARPQRSQYRSEYESTPSGQRPVGLLPETQSTQQRPQREVCGFYPAVVSSQSRSSEVQWEECAQWKQHQGNPNNWGRGNREHSMHMAAGEQTVGKAATSSATWHHHDKVISDSNAFYACGSEEANSYAHSEGSLQSVAEAYFQLYGRRAGDDIQAISSAISTSTPASNNNGSSGSMDAPISFSDASGGCSPYGSALETPGVALSIEYYLRQLQSVAFI